LLVQLPPADRQFLEDHRLTMRRHGIALMTAREITQASGTRLVGAKKTPLVFAAQCEAFESIEFIQLGLADPQG
jgi:hypothetical protein